VEKSLKLTQFTMDRAGDMVLWGAPDSRYIYVNQAACEGFGYTRDEMIALTTFDTCPSWTQETWASTGKRSRKRARSPSSASSAKRTAAISPAKSR
jgi:PAS domain S-box-containing protein